MPNEPLKEIDFGFVKYTLDSYGFWHTVTVGHWSIAGMRNDFGNFEVRLEHGIYSGLYVEAKVDRMTLLTRWREGRGLGYYYQKLRRR